MGSAPESCWLEDFLGRHDIAASLFMPFLIERVRGSAQATETVVNVTLRGIDSFENPLDRLRLSWSASSIPTRPLGVQEHIVTEWAALGMACVMASHYLRRRVLAVAAPGDRFDYWTTDGNEQFGLEVSGTMADDVEVRHREKVRQLLDNPHAVSGHVVVVGFSTREAILSLFSASWGQHDE